MTLNKRVHTDTEVCNVKTHNYDLNNVCNFPVFLSVVVISSDLQLIIT
jgi:hypothetical protein